MAVFEGRCAGPPEPGRNWMLPSSCGNDATTLRVAPRGQTRPSSKLAEPAPVHRARGASFAERHHRPVYASEFRSCQKAMWDSLPEFGTGVLYAILVSAAYTFAVSIAAGRGRPRLLQSARLGAYGTTAPGALRVLLVAHRL